MPEGDEHAVSADHAALEEGAGRDLSRILSLSDGIFGFAMTLMVLTLVVPAVPMGTLGSNDSSYLAAQLQSRENAFTWYVLGFLLIAVWWIGHHALFARIVRWTRALIGLNLAFLLTIAVTPFFIELLENYDGTVTATAAYAASQVVSSVCFGALVVYATRGKGILDDRVTPRTRRLYEENAVLRSLVFVGAFGVALVLPQYALYVLLATLLVQARRRHAKGSPPEVGSPPAPGPATTRPGPGAPGAGAPLPPS